MSRKERHIIVKNRTSVFSLKPEKIFGIKVIRVVHKLSCNFYNPSSTREPLFWRGTVLEGIIDIPESLKKVSSIINSEDIYSFKDLSINGKSVLFKKKILHKNSNQIEYQITCNKVAKARTTYHVSYSEEGLYEYDDFYEDEIRTSLQEAAITVEKPKNLLVSINLFGENATLSVLTNSSRIYCVEIRGKSTSGNGFALHWRRAGILEHVKQKISTIDRIRILACVAFAFSIFFASFIVVQYSVWLLPLAGLSAVVALLALIYAFSPQYTREIIRSLKEIASSQRRLNNHQDKKER